MGFRSSGYSSPKGSSGGKQSNKPEKNFSNDEHRINERIRVPEVRLIDEKGNQVGVVPTIEALNLAREKGLDLMEVAPDARPPVCKIADYGKFKYQQKKKEHEARKKQVIIKVKEIQLRPHTENHDVEYKVKNARQFIEDGDKVKFTIMFRGREVAFAENGYKLMKLVEEKVQDIAVVEAPAKMEGKRMHMIIAPGSKSAAKK